MSAADTPRRLAGARRLAFLFTPQYLALYVVVIAFAYLCFTVLAPWQLGKNTKTSRENEQISNSLSEAPIPVTTVLPQQDSVADGQQWRQVIATGHYQPEAQVLARLRVNDGEPAYEVLVPFRVDRGPTVLVDRGFVKPSKGTAVPQFDPPPTGTVTITARLRVSEGATAGRDPFRGDGVQQVYSINTAQIAQVTGIPLTGPYLQLIDGQPGGLGTISLPHLDSGPFLSYGIQWIAFGIVAPIGVGYFLVAEIKQRRREKKPTNPTAAGPAPLSPEQKLADRYGRRP